VDAERADGIADEIPEIGVLVVGRFHFLAFFGVHRRQDQRPVERERETRREEERDRDHVGRVVVEVAVGVADVVDPIEVRPDPVGERMAPGAEQDGPDHDEGRVGEDRHAEGEGDMIADAELAADFHLAQQPGDEGSVGADRDDLPEPALAERCRAEPVFERRRVDRDQPGVPHPLNGRPVEDQSSAEGGEEECRDPEEAHVEGAHPEIEQIAADQRPAPDAVLSFEGELSHLQTPMTRSGRNRAPVRKLVGLSAADP